MNFVLIPPSTHPPTGLVAKIRFNFNSNYKSYGIFDDDLCHFFSLVHILRNILQHSSPILYYIGLGIHIKNDLYAYIWICNLYWYEFQNGSEFLLSFTPKLIIFEKESHTWTCMQRQINIPILESKVANCGY